MSYIDKIFPNPLPTVEEIEAKYKRRDLPEGAKVTRVAPSPTGFMHIGGIYTALICERVAHQSNGVFFLRIEDTDTKREVEGATELICSSLANYDIVPDEGFDAKGNEIGLYAPYKQSARKEIYQAYIKQMLLDGRAYPCFATTEELEALHKTQETSGARPGYYGRWAKYRDYPVEKIEEKLAQGIPFVIRFKSHGSYDNKIVIQDGLKGKINFPENDLDIVIMKSDGLPTYHFAHVIDDYLMGTTHVIRGDEWLSSLPLHIQLFKAMGFKVPKYTHIAPIQKMDGDSRRKLSKRHDPEADVRYYDKVGYPRVAVIEYLLNLVNSNFEDWRRNNQTKSYKEFPVSLNKLSPSGALFDFVKLNNISKEIISKMTTDEIYSAVYDWAKVNDVNLLSLMDANSDYVKAILSIERTGAKNARKDIAKYSDVPAEIEYFFDDKFALSDEAKNEIRSIKNYREIVNAYIPMFNENDSKDIWFAKMLQLAEQFNFAKNGKEYKANPDAFNGDISTLVKIFRILITGKTQTPDLSEIQHVMGEKRVLARLNEVNNI
ncbi:MAG: glutamate--tRNA ligase [bacterium]|nr:glutamate--tRNA ligase [bacterium]